MQALILNMASATDRMGFMAAQMAHFGLPFERIEAVTPDTLEPPADDPVWHRWQRPMRVTEMALCASHMAAWRRIIALDAPCLVLEDDAVLAEALPAFLQNVAGLSGIDHVSLETRSRKKLIARTPHPAAPMRRLYQDRTGSAAMVIWPDGARKLLQRASMHAAPSDALISSTYSLRSYQAVPALSVQLDQADAYGVPQAIPTRSLIDAVGKPPPEAFDAGARRAFRARRIAAQVRMGWRLLRFAAVARRIHVRPATDWPQITP
jgi:glycosyl transferase family 25